MERNERILAALRKNGLLTETEIANLLPMPHTTVQRGLRDLASGSLVVREKDGRWRDARLDRRKASLERRVLELAGWEFIASFRFRDFRERRRLERERRRLAAELRDLDERLEGG